MLITQDHFVPHVSTAPANAGQLVGLHVREKAASRSRGAARVVLFVHGATVPSMPDFDLDYKTHGRLEGVRRGEIRVDRDGGFRIGADAIREKSPARR